MVDLFCTIKNVIVKDDCIECSIFLLQNWKLDPGTILEQRRDGAIITTQELVSYTNKLMTLKKSDNEILFGDTFYAEAPFIEVKEVTQLSKVLAFSGKNWRLASTKKWKQSEISLEGCKRVGELSVNGKDYDVYKIEDENNPTTFAAKLKEVFS